MTNFIGTRKSDVINGTSGDDFIDGAGGVDRLSGGAGNDRIVYQNDANRGSQIDGGTGDDTLVVGQAAHIDLGAANQDAGFLANRITGFENLDASGSSGAVILSGSAGVNQLSGGAGADVIRGGGGADVLRGGAGNDVFVYGAASDSNAAGRDRILDFVVGEDKIDLRGLAAAGVLRWGSGAQVHGVWIENGGENTLVRADVDGDGLADLTIELAGSVALSADSFLGVSASANQAPVANADSAAVLEDTELTASGNVLANDSDPEGAGLVVVAPGIYDGQYGRLEIAADGSYTYTLANGQVQSLAAGETLHDTFSYRASDGALDTEAVLDISITGTNDAPVVSGAVTGAAPEDGATVTLSALANASDVDHGAVLSVVDVPATLPAGVTYDSATSAFSLNPADAAYQALAAGETVTVTVNYGVSDGTATAAASASWTITGTNDAPVVSGAVTGAGTEDGATIALNALANASDVDQGAVLSVVDVPATLPAGVIYDSATGAFSLNPADAAYQALAAGETMTVTVNYGVSDGTATTAASATWTITGTNDAPVVSGAVTGATAEDGATVTLDALANASDVDHGSVLFVVDVPATLPAGVTYDSATSAFSLNPADATYQALAAGETMTVTVNYGVSDGTATTAASATWTVTGTNDAPVVSRAVTGAATEDGAAVTLNALANASDVDHGAVLSVVDVPATLPAGVTYDSANSAFSLNPADAAYQALAAGETITVTVNYGVSDGTATTAASATWTITGTNDAPVVSGAVTGAATEDGATVALNALANASDVDHAAVLSVVDVPATLPAGVIYDSATGAFSLNPADAAYQALAAGETMTVTVNYGVSDGTATTAASATWTISGTNDAPVVSRAVTGAATEDGAAVTLNALANASDVDHGAVLSVVDVPATLPAGVTYDSANSAFSLNPADAAYQALAAGEMMTVTVNYGVSDGTATTAASATWTITGTNDAPVVSGEVTGAATEDGATVTLNALANASDVDHGAVLSVLDVPATLPAGVTYDSATNIFSLNPADAAYQALAAGETMTVTVNYGVSDGTATTAASATWTITGTNDAPVVSGAVTGAATESGPTVTLNALAHATDIDHGATLAVVNLPGALPAGVSFNSAASTFTLNPSASAYQSLAAGETLVVTINYGVSDGTATTAASASWTITGTNDAPAVSGTVTGAATEDGAAVTLNALANATDIDHGAVLSVVNLPAQLPAGVTYDLATGTFTLDPSHAAFQSLGEGETTTVRVNYGVSDGLATTAASVSWTVTGTFDVPVNHAPVVSGPVTGSATEGATPVVLDALANASDADAGTTLSVVNVGALPAGVTFDAATHTFRLDPTSSAYNALALGQSATVTVTYGVSDGETTTATSAVWTVTGTNDAPTLNIGLPDRDVDSRAAFTYTLPNKAFQDADAGTVLTYSAQLDNGDPLPSWMTLDPTTGTITGTAPDLVDIAPFTVVLTANDGAGGQRSDTFMLRVIGSITGTDGDDVLTGGTINDRMYGLDGNDNLSGGAGNDLMDGGRGDDTLNGGEGDDTLIGGEGNDTLDDATYGVNSYSGGAGNDTLRVYGGLTQTLIDGGEGNDTIVLSSRGASQTITTGSGQDVVRMLGVTSAAAAAATITDFTTGAGGDLVDLSGFLSNSNGWKAGIDPFQSGYLRLVQNGTDAELQWDRDGAANTYNWSTALVFKNTATTAFTIENFSPAYNPDGSGIGNTINGDDGDNTLTGTASNDLINGYGGKDKIDGAVGDDHLYGGAGDDDLTGGVGKDKLYGGADNDKLQGGDDDDLLDGGDGNDNLNGGFGNDVLQGGIGNDIIEDSQGANAFYGGDGNDTLSLLSLSVTQTAVDAGTGDDTIIIDRAYANQTVTTGTGMDTILLKHVGAGTGIVTVTDFTAGTGGDVLDISEVISALSGRPSNTNPFTNGFLRLQQNGAHTELQWDADGSAGPGAWATLVVLRDTEASTLTRDNFKPTYNPDGTGQGRTYDGTEGVDSLTGTLDNDVFNGLGGDDVLRGNDGQDVLNGGEGKDDLDGGYGNDILNGGNGADHLEDRYGNNQLNGEGGDDDIYIFASSDRQTVDGGTGRDTIRVEYTYADHLVTTGADRDTIAVKRTTFGPGVVTVTDFTAGAGGDLIDLAGLLSDTSGRDTHADPFQTGYLRLVQNGTQAELQLDTTGGGNGAQWRTVIVLQNTQASSLTLDNFSPAYAPDGSGTGLTINGSASADQLAGTLNNDILNGLGDNDKLTGDDGHDTLNGGEGDDNLDGGYGNDILNGGNGADHLEDRWGNNQLNGEGGDDDIYIFASSDHQTVDGGSGQDTIRVEYTYTDHLVTTGTDRDTIAIKKTTFGPGVVTVTDFTAGAGGDLIDLTGLLADTSGRDTHANPFQTGYLRLLQNGTQTELQLDTSGSANGGQWRTIIVLQNTTAGSLTSDNFSSGYAPDGHGMTIDGSSSADTLTGTVNNDILNGMGGDDKLNGGDGDDTVNGDAGKDTLDGGYGNDILNGGDDNDTLEDNQGNNQLNGGAGDDKMTVYASRFSQVVNGGEGQDKITVDYTYVNHTVSTGAGSDTLLLSHVSGNPGVVTVTDFTTGAGGDLLDLSGLNSQSSGLSGGDPFAKHYVRLLQSGDDVALQWDANGDTGGAAWITVAVLEDTTAASFTSANFTQGYVPAVAQLATLVGVAAPAEPDALA